ncbi:MAG: Cache 3/Cache 2 fusion domain-containing protein [Pirellulales bacterium]
MLNRAAARARLLRIVLVMILLPLAGGLLAVYLQSRRLTDEAARATSALATQDIDHLVDGVYALCSAQQDKVWTILQVAHQAFLRAGGVTFLPDRITWTAVDQFTKRTRPVQLRKMAISEKWLGQNYDLATPSPIVDEVGKAMDCSCTIFQRMNERGDMLRACTNVRDLAGKRAVGTYIPIVHPDGRLDPVLSCVLRGQTYTGRAYVVNAWYITSYEPIYGAGKEVVGMLFVGVPERKLTTLQQRVRAIRLGETGRVFVLDGKGNYVVSTDGKSDGKSVLEVRDSAGNDFVREICRIAARLQPGEKGSCEYAWQEPGESSVSHRICRFVYLKKWDWIIAAEAGKEELQSAATRIRAISDQSSLLLAGMTVLSLAGVALIWYLTTRVARSDLQLVVDSIPDPFMVIDRDYRVVLANKAVRDTAGEPWRGRAMRCHQVSHHRDTPCDEVNEPCPLRAVLATKGTVRATHLHQAADGSGRYIDLIASPVLGDNGEVLHVIEAGRDVTEHRLAEEALRRSKAALEDANRRLEKANGAKSDFLAGMSHEIRTPLTAILGYADLLLDDHVAPDEGREYLAGIRRNGSHLLSLINGILDLSKIEAGKLTVDMRPCEFRLILADVAGSMQVRADERDVALSVECDDALPEWILTDGDRLRQILYNLLANAIKFTEHGSVRVAVSALACWQDAKPALQIQVIDTGIGIGPETVARLFQPFVQADASTSKKYGGTGLGLVISRRIAGLLGGEVTAESVLGRGSTFTLVLPVGDLDDAAKPPAQSGSTAAEGVRSHACSAALADLTGLKILLVDDGLDNQRLIRTVLQKAGAEVEVAENGQVAIVRIQTAGAPRFDVVLMDMQMPVMDGFEATLRLRAFGYEGPILALTAFAMSGDRDKCLAAGCNDYVTKPIDRAGLLQTVLANARRRQPAGSCGDAAPA